MKNKRYLINIGLAATLLYAGIAAFINPNDWIGFVPMWVENFGVSREFALHAHSIVEIILGIWLLTDKHTKLAALITALDVAAIIIVSGMSQLSITFRDIGLLFMALYLFVTNDEER